MWSFILYCEVKFISPQKLDIKRLYRYKLPTQTCDFVGVEWSNHFEAIYCDTFMGENGAPKITRYIIRNPTNQTVETINKRGKNVLIMNSIVLATFWMTFAFPRFDEHLLVLIQLKWY